MTTELIELLRARVDALDSRIGHISERIDTLEQATALQQSDLDRQAAALRTVMGEVAALKEARPGTRN